jgi:hypothetical protein
MGARKSQALLAAHISKSFSGPDGINPYIAVYSSHFWNTYNRLPRIRVHKTVVSPERCIYALVPPRNVSQLNAARSSSHRAAGSPPSNAYHIP